MAAEMKWVLGATLFGVMATFLSLFAAGAGHGTNVPISVLLPWSMLVLLEGAGDTVAMACALAQYPIYTALVRYNRRLVVPIAIAHLVTATSLVVHYG